MNAHNHLHHTSQSNHFTGMDVQLVLAFIFVLLFIMYIIATVVTNRRYKSWPLYRTVFWTLGIIFVVTAIAGPLANRAIVDFKAHMLSHLLIGMLAPLCMALGAPITLILRTLSTQVARRLSRVLRSWPIRIYTHPIIASLLNIGGLWLLYTTDLYSLMHENTFLHLMVHLHVFIAGYLFTVSIIYIDPVYHRISFLYRAIVLIVALAGHGILSKYIYVHPPNSVSVEQAEAGSIIMYYGGDGIDAILIFVLCLQWFRATRPRPRMIITNVKQGVINNNL